MLWFMKLYLNAYTVLVLTSNKSIQFIASLPCTLLFHAHITHHDYVINSISIYRCSIPKHPSNILVCYMITIIMPLQLY